MYVSVCVCECGFLNFKNDLNTISLRIPVKSLYGWVIRKSPFSASFFHSMLKRTERTVDIMLITYSKWHKDFDVPNEEVKKNLLRCARLMFFLFTRFDGIKLIFMDWWLIIRKLMKSTICLVIFFSSFRCVLTLSSFI